MPDNTNDTEIIDLTTSDPHEVVVLDSEASAVVHWSGAIGSDDDDEEPVVKAATEDMADGLGTVGNDADVGMSKKRLRRTTKKRKREVEDGEIVEANTAVSSIQVSREHSSDEQDDNIADNSDSNHGPQAKMETYKDLAADEHTTPNAQSTSLPSKPKASKKAKKSKRRERARGHDSPSANDDGASLFFVDDQPAELPTVHATIIPPPAFLAPSAAVTVTVGGTSNSRETVPGALLLPAHVSVLAEAGNIPIVQITAPVPTDSDDEDYIDYLDYDDRKVPGLVRYFDEVDEAAEAKVAKATRIVCKRCGAEGEHKTHECPVLICLTCGARDEHGTRSCPISKTCFTCGMKGHINRDCPNRYTSRGRMPLERDCDRCGSIVHITRECPTIWRVYEYVSDAERQTILEAREEKSTLAIGAGGEGYIGPEDWCYNCGGFGHLGDDCKDIQHPSDWPDEMSAFSEYNTRAGPFADAQHEAQPQSKAAKQYADDRTWGDGHGSALPLDVGRKGKQKEKARMEKRAREQEDDGDDWFARRAGAGGKGKEKEKERTWSHTGRTPKGPRTARPEGKKISFADLGRDDGRFERDWRDRERDTGRDRDRRDDRNRDRDRDRRDDRDRERERDRRGGASDRSYWNGLPAPVKETDSLQIRGVAQTGAGGVASELGLSIRGAAARQKDNERDEDAPDSRPRRRSGEDREKYRRRDARETSPRRGPRYRGGYAR